MDIVPSIEPTSNMEEHIKAAYENRMEIKMYDLMSRRALRVARAAEGVWLLPQIISCRSCNEFWERVFSER